MKKLSSKQKRYLASRSRYQLKKSKRLKFNFKSVNLDSENLRKRRLDEQKRKRKGRIIYRPHQEFSLHLNVGNVIRSIKELKEFASKKYEKRELHIELEKVQSIDIGAICILLSVIEELAIYKVFVTGSFPRNIDCRRIFAESGFLNHVKTINGTAFKSDLSKNLIIKRGKNRTDNRAVGEVILSATELIIGKRIHYPPIFTIIQEISGNSVEHAYFEKEHWLLGINYDSENERVIFTFADNGFGILNTLYRKLGKKFFDSISLNSNADILKGAFLKKYSSRHHLHINRNKGLPIIKEYQDRGLVKDFKVITNNVEYSISSDESRTLKVDYSGTFYYWVLDLDCIERWKRK